MIEQIQTAQQSVNKMVDTIHGIAATHESMEVSIGKVIAPPPNLRVAWNNIILEKEQLYISERILVGHKRTIRGHIKSAVLLADCGCGNKHLHGQDNDYTATMIYTDTLKVGDLVSVVPLKKAQQFIITDKLVYLPEYKN